MGLTATATACYLLSLTPKGCRFSRAARSAIAATLSGLGFSSSLFTAFFALVLPRLFAPFILLLRRNIVTYFGLCFKSRRVFVPPPFTLSLRRRHHHHHHQAVAVCRQVVSVCYTSMLYRRSVCYTSMSVRKLSSPVPCRPSPVPGPARPGLLFSLPLSPPLSPSSFALGTFIYRLQKKWDIGPKFEREPGKGQRGGGRGYFFYSY